jgi:hypothetical protein
MNELDNRLNRLNQIKSALIGNELYSRDIMNLIGCSNFKKTLVLSYPSVLLADYVPNIDVSFGSLTYNTRYLDRFIRLLLVSCYDAGISLVVREEPLSRLPDVRIPQFAGTDLISLVKLVIPEKLDLNLFSLQEERPDLKINIYNGQFIPELLFAQESDQHCALLCAMGEEEKLSQYKGDFKDMILGHTIRLAVTGKEANPFSLRYFGDRGTDDIKQFVSARNGTMRRANWKSANQSTQQLAKSLSDFFEIPIQYPPNLHVR